MGLGRMRLLATMLVLAGTIGSAQAEAGWSIVQTAKGSPMGSGATILITPTGMRTSDAKSGVSMFTKGPSWNVVLFNTQTKSIYQTSLQGWIQSIEKRRGASGGRFSGATWKRGQTAVQVAGAKAYEFLTDRPPTGGARAVKGPDGKLRNMPAISGARLYVAQEIATPEEVSKLISQIYGVPDCKRIPLKLIVNEVGKAVPTVAVDTVRIARVNVPDAMFQVPTGFKAVKTDMEVFIDRQSMDAIDSMLKDL